LLPNPRTVRGFAEGMGWLAQIGLFVMLGLLSSPNRLPAAIAAAITIGLVLTLLARPLSVLISATPFRVPWREQAFLGFSGLRGAVPIVLTTIPATAGLAGSTTIFDIVFVLVHVFTALQAPLPPAIARRLGVISGGPVTLGIDAAPLDEFDGELVTARIPNTSRLAGVFVVDLRLPSSALVSLVVRDGRPTVPDASTRLWAGDQVIVVCLPGTREAVERRLRDVPLWTAGPLAR
jgi:cell volume regulation protein A